MSANTQKTRLLKRLWKDQVKRWKAELLKYSTSLLMNTSAPHGIDSIATSSVNVTDEHADNVAAATERRSIFFIKLKSIVWFLNK